MTASDVLLDTWAWWEILFETPVGQELSERYVEDPTVGVHTSALAIGEIVAKLHTLDTTHDPEEEDGVLQNDVDLDRLEDRIVSSIRAFSELHDVRPAIAQQAGAVRSKLRESKATASLADALMLVTARELGAVLVSDDGAFDDEPDVRAS